MQSYAVNFIRLKATQLWKFGSLDSKILLGPWIDSAQMCHIASSSAAFLYLAWKFKTSVAVPHAAVKRQKFDLISHVNASKICTTLLKHTILSLIWDKGTFKDSVEQCHYIRPIFIVLKVDNKETLHCLWAILRWYYNWCSGNF